MVDIGVIAFVVVAYGLLSQRLEGMSITGPMVFVTAGIVLGPELTGVVGLELTAGAGLLFAELTLVIVLFADAARLSLPAVQKSSAVPARLLGIGMPLTIALGVVLATVLLGELEFWEGAMVAVILAPTDAALGKAVVASTVVPARVRQALNVESGLNDGLAVPFLALFLALSLEEAGDATEWIGFAAAQIGLGAAVGVGVGLAGGWLVDHATRRELIGPIYQQIVVLALAVGAWALAEEVGGNGFIAAFAGGLATGRTAVISREHLLNFTEDQAELLTAVVFFIFGVGALGYLEAAGPGVVLFGLLALTLTRMLPVAISLIGTGLQPSTVAFVAWFGPRGLASIILTLVVASEEPDLPGLDILLAAMTVTVLASVLAHGLSAGPLSQAYAKRLEAVAGDAPELQEVPDLPTRPRITDPL